MRIVDNIPIFGSAVDEGALTQIKVCAQDPRASSCALMADHHKGYAVPIGGVVAYENAVSPSGVGYDIACGNKAVRLDISKSDVPGIRADMPQIMDQIWKHISFGIGRKNPTPVEHPVFDENPTAWSLEATKDLKFIAQDQLGTVGSGNHYVDIFEDEQERIWVGVHFGSRGLGHKTATWFLQAGGAKDGMDVEPLVLPADSDLGQQYIVAMGLAGQYAYAGRDWVCKKVADLVGAHIVEEVHNHHNFAWLEEHNGKKLWVVRKGATPAFPGQRGFVGASMAEPAVIIEGVESPECKPALYSTVHGAGRIMGRRQAAGKSRFIARWRCQDIRNCDFTAAKGGFHKDEGGPTPKCPKCGHKLRLEQMRMQLSEGKVTKEMMDSWVKKSGVELRGAGLDESPDCYKRLGECLAEQGGTIRILHTLKPLGVAMAGADEYDPYKD